MRDGIASLRASQGRASDRVERIPCLLLSYRAEQLCCVVECIPSLFLGILSIRYAQSE